MKVGQLGASMLRGNGTNFYIRSDDDLDDQDTSANRGAQEYPHIHVNTTGPDQNDDILYIGITFGGGGQNIAIYMNGVHQTTIQNTQLLIAAHCPGISQERVHPLAQYLHGYRVSRVYQ